MKKFVYVLIFVVLLPTNCFAITKEQCELLESLSKFEGYSTIQYKGKTIRTSDLDIISSLMSKFYSTDILINSDVLSSTLSDDAFQCSKEGHFQKSVTSHPSRVKSFEDLSRYIAGYVDQQIKREQYKIMQKNKTQAEDKLYNYVMFCSQRLFDPGLTDEEIKRLSDMHDENYLVSSEVRQAAVAIIKITGLISDYKQLEAKINEIEIYTIQYNEDDYIRSNESIFSKYKYDCMIKGMNLLRIDRKLFPDLYSNFEAFKAKFDQALEQYSTAIKQKEKALHEAKKQEQQRQSLIAQQKDKQEKEARQQRLKEKCTQFISSFGLSSDEYNYIIPGGGTFANELSLGEFLCMSKGAGALAKFSKPGLFSDSYDFKYESDGKVTYLEFVEVIDDESKKHSESISRKNGTFLRLSKISSDTESKKLKSMTEHSIVMDPLIYGIIIQAQVHSPELFQ